MQAQLDAANAKIPAEVRADIPELPDPYDDDFETKMAARDEAITSAANFDAKARQADLVKEADAKAQEVKRQEVLVNSVKVYTDRAKDLGVTTQELEVAGSALVQAGINDELSTYILSDDKGPLITKHLAENPAAIDAMRAMTTMQAAVYIATQVKPNVSVKPKQSAPSPADTLSGGAPQSGNGWPEGATFE